MTANLHYFHKLMGTQNEESESIRYFSSAIPFHPTYLPALSHEDFLQ